MKYCTCRRNGLRRNAYKPSEGHRGRFYHTRLKEGFEALSEEDLEDPNYDVGDIHASPPRPSSIGAGDLSREVRAFTGPPRPLRGFLDDPKEGRSGRWPRRATPPPPASPLAPLSHEETGLHSDLRFSRGYSGHRRNRRFRYNPCSSDHKRSPRRFNPDFTHIRRNRKNPDDFFSGKNMRSEWQKLMDEGVPPTSAVMRMQEIFGMKWTHIRRKLGKKFGTLPFNRKNPDDFFSGKNMRSEWQKLMDEGVPPTSAVMRMQEIFGMKWTHIRRKLGKKFGTLPFNRKNPDDFFSGKNMRSEWQKLMDEGVPPTSAVMRMQEIFGMKWTHIRRKLGKKFGTLPFNRRNPDNHLLPEERSREGLQRLRQAIGRRPGARARKDLRRFNPEFSVPKFKRREPTPDAWDELVEEWEEKHGPLMSNLGGSRRNP